MADKINIKMNRYNGTDYDQLLPETSVAQVDGLQAALDAKQPTLTPGQNIAISGNVIGTRAFPCNPNLLDNWYFGNPVNQRGQTSYTESWKYSIDRWLCAGDGKVTIADGHCVFYSAIDQGLSVEMSDILGCTMTASLLLTDGTLITGTAVNTDNSIDIPFVSAVNGMFLSLNATDLSGHRRFRTYIAPERAVLAVKLELGTEQTLAHQDANGNWVLNEIPDYGEQLRRCQRYYVKLNDRPMGAGWIYSSTYANILINTPVTMRAVPTITYNSSIGSINTITGQKAISSLAPLKVEANGISVDMLAANNDYPANGTPAFWSGAGSVELSADL